MKETVNPKVRASAAGFTLVELMVVVAIIGILAAVAGPRVQAFRARGVQSEAKANLNSIFLAQAAFQDANDRFADAGNCDPDALCAGADGPTFTFRANTGAKYRYNVVGEAGRWAAGAASRQPLLRNRTDIWRVNTNKDLCAIDDVTRDAGIRTCRAAIGNVAGATAIPTINNEDNPN